MWKGRAAQRRLKRDERSLSQPRWANYPTNLRHLCNLCNLCSVIEKKDVDGIRTLKLAHGKVSAMDIELGEALAAEMKSALDLSVKAVIITGSGASFSAGVDLFRLIKDGPDYARRFLPVLDEFLCAALTFPKPAIA